MRPPLIPHTWKGFKTQLEPATSARKPSGNSIHHLAPTPASTLPEPPGQGQSHAYWCKRRRALD